MQRRRRRDWERDDDNQKEALSVTAKVASLAGDCEGRSRSADWGLALADAFAVAVHDSWLWRRHGAVDHLFLLRGAAAIIMDNQHHPIYIITFHPSDTIRSALYLVSFNHPHPSNQSPYTAASSSSSEPDRKR